MEAISPDKGPVEELKRLRQELARCQEENQTLSALCHRIGSRSAALNFRAFQLNRDNQTLQFHVAGLRGDAEYCQREVERLRAEVGALRRVICNCPSETDRCRPFLKTFLHAEPSDGEFQAPTAGDAHG